MSPCLGAWNTTHQMQQSVEKCKQLLVDQLHWRTAQHCRIAVCVTAFVAFAQLHKPRSVKSTFVRRPKSTYKSATQLIMFVHNAHSTDACGPSSEWHVP